MLRKASQCASALLKRAGGGAGAKGGRAKATAGNADSGTPYAVAYITVSGQGEGRRIAGEIVQAQLAACVNLVPSLQSVFVWEGQVQNEEESMLIVKTTRQLIPELRTLITKTHSYDCPEVIAMPISDGHEPFLNWIGETVKVPSTSS